MILIISYISVDDHCVYYILNSAYCLLTFSLEMEYKFESDETSKCTSINALNCGGHVTSIHQKPQNISSCSICKHVHFLLPQVFTELCDHSFI